MRNWWGHRRAGGGRSTFARAADEVRAEIEDHLAASAAEVQGSGVPSDQASQVARQRFGDVERIQRRCTWIQMGDQIMLRAVLIITLVVLTLGLVTVGIGTWRLESSLSDRMDAIREQLAAMNRVQQTVLQRVSGRLYLRDKDVPAANVQVAIGSLLDGKFVHRLVTDDHGEFHSSPLPAGDYFVLVPLQGAANTKPFFIGNPTQYTGMFIGGVSVGGDISGDQSTPRYHVQSGPLHVYPGIEPPKVELDVAFYHGDIRFGLRRPVPDVIQVGDKRVDVGIKLVLRANDLQSLPWASSSSVPPGHWPVLGHAFGQYSYQFDQFSFPAYLLQGSQATNLPPMNSIFPEGWELDRGPRFSYWSTLYSHSVGPNERYKRLPKGTYSVAAVFYFLPTQGDQLLANFDYQPLMRHPWWSSGEDAHKEWEAVRQQALAADTQVGQKLAEKTGQSVEELRMLWWRRRFLGGATDFGYSVVGSPFPAPEQLRQIQVVDGHETVIEVTFPEGLEESIRGALSQTEPNQEELSELLAARVAELVVHERPTQ